MSNRLSKLLVLAVLLTISATAQGASDFSTLSLSLTTPETEMRLAKSYWLGGADIGLTFEGDDDETRCRAMGYTSDSCPGNETPVKFCGSNNQYHMCGCDSSVYKYTTENCPYGSVPDADVCDGYSRGCTCGESGYVWDEESGSCIFSCTSDSDCPTGEVCDISEGQCYECLQSRDCGEGYECIDHQCEEVDLCDGVECTGGQSCNENTGECECPSGTELLDGQCQEANCLNGGKGCPDSTPVCREDGQCVQCTSTNQSACGADEKCNSDNKCEKIDRCDGVNCSGGKDCNPDNGQCECPSGTEDYGSGVCEAPNCSNGGDSCSGSTPHCTDDGRCVQCTQNSHCNTSRGEICAIDHTCQTTDLCWDAEDRCPVDSTCNSATGVCTCPGELTDVGGICDCASGYKKNTSCVDCTQDSHCGDANQWACQNNSCVNLCANVSCTNGTCVRGKCQCNAGFVETANGCEAPNCNNGGVKCMGNTDVCNTATGECVECTQDSHCGDTNQWDCQNNSCVNLCANVSCTNGTCVRGECQCNTGFVETANGCEAPNCNNTPSLCDPDTEKCNTSTGKCEKTKERSQCYQKIVAKGYLAAETTEELKEILTTNYGDYPDLMVYILGPIEIDNIDFTSIGIGTASLTLSDTYMALSENICTTQDLMNDKMQQPSLTVTGNLEVQGFVTTQLANLSIANLNIYPGGYLTSTRVHTKTIPLTIENVNFNGGYWSIASADTVTNMPYIVQIENLTASDSAMSNWAIEKGAVTIDELNENSGWLEITMPNTSHLNITSLNMLGSYLSIGSDSLVDIEKTKLTGGSIASITLNGTRMNMAEAEIADKSQFDIIMKYGSKFYDLSNEEGRPIGKYVLQPGMRFTVDNSTSTYENCLYNYYGSSHELQEFCTPNSRYNALYNGLKLFLRFNTSGQTNVSYYTCKYKDWDYPWDLGSHTQNGQGKWTDNWGCITYVFGMNWY